MRTYTNFLQLTHFRTEIALPLKTNINEMKKIILAAAIAITAFASCSKNDGTKVTPTTPTTGTIQCVNNSANPYEVYINTADKGSLAGNHNISYTYDNGSYTVKVVQLSGYAVYPTIETYTVTLSSNNQVISFP